MLEFIVLGQIPGTNIVLSFSWVVVIAAGVVGFSVARHELTHRHISSKVNIEELAI